MIEMAPCSKEETLQLTLFDLSECSSYLSLVDDPFKFTILFSRKHVSLCGHNENVVNTS